MVNVDAIAAAIAQYEGSALAGGGWRNNNPGNLRDAAGSIWPEYAHDARGFVIFPDADTGWYWLRHQIWLDMVERGLSLWEFISKYAPGSENNTAAYYAFLQSKVGAPAAVSGGEDSAPGLVAGGGEVTAPRLAAAAGVLLLVALVAW